MPIPEITEDPAEIEQEGAKGLDQRLIDAIGRKNLDEAMACFWNDPALVVVLYGNVCRGPEAVRAALKEFFAQNESIQVEVNEVSHLRSGDGVLGVGTATFTMKPLGGPPKLMVERWSDLRRKIDGRWVMVLDHTTIVPE